MTKEQQAFAVFKYLGIVHLVVLVNFAIYFIAILVSIATGHLELTAISVWCVFGLFMAGRYVGHLIVVHQKKMDEFYQIIGRS